MSLDLIHTILYFLTGGFIIFLAIIIARDNITNRLNRICGAMLFFAGLGPTFLAFATLIDPTDPNLVESKIFNLFYTWEFFFPLLLMFSWVFPIDRMSSQRHPRSRYLIFLPQILHLVVVLLFGNFIGFLDGLQVDTTSEGFSSLILKPFSVIVSWITLIVSFILSYNEVIFGFINLFYIVATFYFLESSKKLIHNPRLQIQTKVVSWALRISLTLYVIADLGARIFPYTISDSLRSTLMILALFSGTGLLIYATIRYQFLDVRLIFRQSFVYSITSAILVGVYVLLVIQSRIFLQPVFGESTEIISYAFIIIILLLFQPINNWIDEFTRSLFIRTRTDHRNVLERFSRQVISLFEPDKLRQIIEETLKTTLLIENVYFILYDDKVGEYVVLPDEMNQKQVVLDREDLMLRGINLLDSPTFYYSLSAYSEESMLSNELEKRDIKLILPMKDSHHLLGFLALTNKAAGYSYSSEDLNLLGVLSNQMVSALTNARLYVDSLERIRLQEEVSMARQIQLDLLPTKPPSTKTMEISAHSTPSRTVGGDFFDFLHTNDDKVGICIADASGKGMPAALMIAQTQAILKSEVNNGNPIDQILDNMNQQMVASSSSEKYVTLFYGEVDQNTGMFQYSNAGHNYPILVRESGDIELLKTGGPIIGALPEMTYQSDSVKLNKNDIIFFFTDGLSEAMDETEQEYTEERIRDFICNNRKQTPDVLIDSILKDVRSFDPTYPPRDDTTLIALKVNNGF
jgi:serine phosphatase RsbU (regulator of sigma subunit)